MVAPRRGRRATGRGAGGGGGGPRGDIRVAGPLRTCIGCRARKPQSELTRVTRDTDGMLRSARTLSGRGAWLCKASLSCFDAAVRRHAFDKALRGAVAPAQLERLRTDFAPSASPARD